MQVGEELKHNKLTEYWSVLRAANYHKGQGRGT
jgi:hypothetical protein